MQQLALFPEKTGLEAELESFNQFGSPTQLTETRVAKLVVPTYVNEFWTSKQRASSSLHEISYRACFKAQLPAFFIERLTRPGETVYDPFMGRGTAVLEAALRGRLAVGCDINPLSQMLVAPRLEPPSLAAIEERLEQIPFDRTTEQPSDLLVFYHPETLNELCSLRDYLNTTEPLDPVDQWIRMVAVNRLTGHSPGFFSVYTLPPNQAVSVESQRKINQKREQTPPRRSLKPLIVKKSKSLLRRWDSDRLKTVASRAQLISGDCRRSPLKSASVHLVVTSPPFLDVVDYAQDNWLRCWFCGIDVAAVPICSTGKLEEWRSMMTEVFRELKRVLVPNGAIAFEVGEVRSGTVRLEEHVIDCASLVGLTPQLVLVNAQNFTKTANCWGIHNGVKGTNTNRIVLLRKKDG